MGKSGTFNIQFPRAGGGPGDQEAPSLRSLTGLRNRCIMGIMYEAGLRISEALALKPRDVSLEDKRVEVLRGKGHRARTVYYRSDDLALLIERWKARRPPGDYMFRGPTKAATFPPGRSAGPSEDTSPGPVWTPGP